MTNDGNALIFLLYIKFTPYYTEHRLNYSKRQNWFALAGRNIYEVYYNFIRPASCASVNYFYEVNGSKNSQLHYEDKLVVTGEPFALRVIESEKDISGELSFDKAGLSVIFTADHKP